MAVVSVRHCIYPETPPMRTVLLRIPLPGALYSTDYPKARSHPATSASERLPNSISRYRTSTYPALYRFTIRKFGSTTAFYYGETKNLSSRLGHYCGMLRRMLLLHAAVPNVFVEKHPMRHIHYHLANAVAHGDLIELSVWRLPSTKKIKRECLENARRRHYALLHPQATVIHSKARGSGNFESKPPTIMSRAWQDAHTRLVPFAGRSSSKVVP